MKSPRVESWGQTASKLPSAMLHFEYDTLRCQSPECAASCKTALTISTPSLPFPKKACDTASLQRTAMAAPSALTWSHPSSVMRSAMQGLPMAARRVKNRRGFATALWAYSIWPICATWMATRSARCTVRPSKYDAKAQKCYIGAVMNSRIDCYARAAAGSNLTRRLSGRIDSHMHPSAAA